MPQMQKNTCMWYALSIYPINGRLSSGKGLCYVSSISITWNNTRDVEILKMSIRDCMKVPLETSFLCGLEVPSLSYYLLMPEKILNLRFTKPSVGSRDTLPL